MTTVAKKVEVVDNDDGRYMRRYSEGKASWFFWACGWWYTHDTCYVRSYFSGWAKAITSWIKPN